MLVLDGGAVALPPGWTTTRRLQRGARRLLAAVRPPDGSSRRPDLPTQHR